MSSYRLSMLAYPGPYRRAHGPEIVDTANELADGRWSARQSGALVAEGLRTRARLSTGGSAAQAWASGIALALALTHLASFAIVVILYYGRSDVTLVEPSPWRDLLITGIPLAALTVTTRWPMVVLIAAPLGPLLFGHPDDGSWSVPWPLILVTQVPVVVLACVVSVVGDGRRALAPVRAIGLLGALLASGWLLSLEAAVATTVWVELVALSLAGIAVVRLDPRPLAAASALWLMHAAGFSLGLVDSRTYAVRMAVMFGLALCGLFVAGIAGRRWLPATSR